MLNVSFARWLPIHKPPAHTSHDVVALARRALHFRKMGHTGTLDPDVTGVVVLALGKATRLIQYLPGTKTYHAWIRLGITTDSYDRSGHVLEERSVPDLSHGELDHALEAFRGCISQQAPMVSAVSVNGQRLYKLARRGIELSERPFRQVEIHELKLCQWQTPLLELEVTCSSGTYIRALAHDLGESLGCGAILERMERTMANGVSLSQCDYLERLVSLEQNPEPGVPAAALLPHIPTLTLSTDTELLSLFQGKEIAMDAPPGASAEDVFRVYAPSGEWVSLAAFTPEGLKSKIWMLEGSPQA
jgi:tRNA pseudouridine55 synthase